MKIVIDLTSLFDNFSGIELYASNVAKELIKDTSNDYILLFKNEIHSLFLDTRENVKKIVIKGKNKLFFQQFKLLHTLNKIKADKYLFLAFTQPFFFFSKKSVNAIHDVSCYDCKGSNRRIMLLYWKIMFKRISYGNNKIITVSEFSKDRINKVLGIDKNRIVVTYSAKSKSTYNFQYDEVTNNETVEKYLLPKKYLLALSTVEPRKNFSMLINVYSKMVNSGRLTLDLVVVGRKGWMVDDILEGIDDKIKSKIHFTGFIEDKYLPYFYSNSSLFIFPSIYEGFGVPPLEALSFRTLVLSSNSSAMPEVLSDGVVYFDNNNPSALEEKIYSCLDMDIEQKRLIIEKGFLISKKYTWERVTDIIKNEILRNGESK